MNTKEFDKPTGENSALWTSPEREWFQQYLKDSPYNEDCSIRLAESPVTGKGVSLSISFRFYVTSYVATLAIRVADCPEAFKDPNLVPTEKWGTIAESGWGQNSGFNQKYINGRNLIEATAQGEWSAWSPLVQENRSTSYSFKTGENTRFWTAELTDPKLAQAQYEFPMGICPPPKKLPTPVPQTVDVGVVVTSRLHPELGEMEIIGKNNDDGLWLVYRGQHSPTKSGSCERRMLVSSDQIGDPIRWSHRADWIIEEYCRALKHALKYESGVKGYYSDHYSYSRNVVDPRSALN